MDSTDTIIIIIFNFELDVPFITPGGVPGVLHEPIVQAGGLVSTVADYEYSVIDRIKIFTFLVSDYLIAIPLINDTALIGVNVLVIGRYSDGKRLSCK